MPGLSSPGKDRATPHGLRRWLDPFSESVATQALLLFLILAGMFAIILIYMLLTVPPGAGAHPIAPAPGSFPGLVRALLLL